MDAGGQGVHKEEGDVRLLLPPTVSDSNIAIVASRFLQVELELNAHLRRLSFSDPVRYIYNPLEYAWDTHRCYVEKYCGGGQSVLFLGMNPGPFGMAQTGVRIWLLAVLKIKCTCAFQYECKLSAIQLDKQKLLYTMSSTSFLFSGPLWRGELCARLAEDHREGGTSPR